MSYEPLTPDELRDEIADEIRAHEPVAEHDDGSHWTSADYAQARKIQERVDASKNLSGGVVQDESLQGGSLPKNKAGTVSPSQSPLEKELHKLESRMGLPTREPVGLADALWILQNWNTSGLELSCPEFIYAEEGDN